MAFPNRINIISTNTYKNLLKMKEPLVVIDNKPVKKSDVDVVILGKNHTQITTSNTFNKNFAMTKDECELFRTLTTLQDNIPDVGQFRKGEVFIHWLYQNRNKDELSACEIFHINMLRYFGIPNGMETIHIRCACSYTYVTNAMNKAIALLKGSSKIDFQLVPNKDNWEHDTIMEASEYAVDSGKFIYYTHFKGSSRMSPIKEDRRKPICTYIDILYWCYLMYRGLFTSQADLPAIGPIIYYGVNKEYVEGINKDYQRVNPLYQYIGSFQAFDGKVLKNRFRELKLDNKEKRKKYIWNVSNGKYAVEMFMSMIFKEQQVHSIVQLPKRKAAYNMYRDKLCEPLLEEFKNPFNNLKEETRNNKVAVCCIAKNEDLYADEWLNHYRKLGVSHFYWLDNNDCKTEKIAEIENQKDVTVIPLNGINALVKIGHQKGAYQYVYDKYGKEYEWLGFLDLDEFVDIDNNMTLPELLSQTMFKGTTSVSMHWRYYGDNGLVRYDERPLAERFKEAAPIDVKYATDKDENRYIKSFVRTMLPVKCGVHTSKFYGSVNKLADGSIREPFEDIGEVNVNVARIKHYGTKTIEEYIKRKCLNINRATGLNSIPSKERLDWFFNVNEVTEEKLQVIREMLPTLHYKTNK